MRHIRRIYASIFSWVPGPALFAVLRRLFDAFVPAMVTLISVGLFDAAAKVIGGDGPLTGLYIYAALYLIVYLINDLLGFASSIIIQCYVYEKCTAFFRMALYEKFSKLSLIALEDAEVLNRKERVDRAVNNEELSSTFQRTQAILQNGIAVFSLAVVMSRYSLWLMPLCLISVLPYLIARIVRGKEFFYVKAAQAKKTRLQTYLWGLFTARQTAKEMRVMGCDDYIMGKWRDTRDEVNAQLWKVEKKDAISLLLCDGIRIAGYGLSIIIVLLLVVRGDVTVGVFGGAITAFLSLQECMRSLLFDMGRVTEHLSHAADYYSFLDMPEEVDGALEYPGLRSGIALKDVCFKYPNSENYALKSIDLTILKGETVAILGENGSGKTTLSKVLLGLYPTQSGRVLYDGVSVDDFTKDSFYARASAVAQDFVAYNLTLRENVAMSDVARLSADQDIKAALADAEADLDAEMGREFGGKELSGGQWQKIAIARGLFKDSELIVLDEPTSALDPLIEAEILKRFIDATDGKTALIISHRVGLCRSVGRIIVMRDGEVAEDGAHAELLKLDGEYAKLYKAQAKWYAESDIIV